MAGVKGRSGGARPNSGPKAKKVSVSASDPLEFLLAVMEDPEASAEQRIKAAGLALPFKHAKPAGKAKEEKASGGRFRKSAPPKLVVNNG